MILKDLFRGWWLFLQMAKRGNT